MTGSTPTPGANWETGKQLLKLTQQELWCLDGTHVVHVVTWLE